MLIRIATRESALALWQTQFIKKKLEASYPEIQCVLVPMTTEGDQRLDRPLYDLGGKALFMKSLEVAMQEGRADIAVHSLKDVPYCLPEGFTLGAYAARAAVEDVLIGRMQQYTLQTLPNSAVVGTSSLRRKAQLLKARPDLNIQSIRGNINTRLAKLMRGEYDALVLAQAGMARLDLLDQYHTSILTIHEMLPSAGQGVIVVECLSDRLDLLKLLKPLHCHHTYQCVTAERAFIEAFEGDCHTPFAAYAWLESDMNQMHLEGLWAKDDSVCLRKMISHHISERTAQEMGFELAALFV